MLTEEIIGVKSDEKETDAAIEMTEGVEIPDEVRKEIVEKATELKTQNKLRKVFVVIVEGEDGDDKPFYIAYFRRPNLVHFSQYMNFVQKDIVQANKMLATNVFIAGDRELIDDDDLFLYGTMSQLTDIIKARNAEMVKK